jgi:hypothetical protein
MAECSGCELRNIILYYIWERKARKISYELRVKKQNTEYKERYKIRIAKRVYGSLYHFVFNILLFRFTKIDILFIYCYCYFISFLFNLPIKLTIDRLANSPIHQFTN